MGAGPVRAPRGRCSALRPPPGPTHGQVVVNAPTVSDLRAVTTVSIARAGAFLNLSQATAYRAAAEGTLPTITVGKHRRVPTPRLLALVGLPYEPLNHDHDHDQAPAAPTQNDTNGCGPHEQSQARPTELADRAAPLAG